MNLRSSLHQFSDRLLSPLGVRLVRIGSNRIRGIDPFLDLECLLDHPQDPVIFDVGANDGEMIEEFLGHFHGATVVAFEPFANCYRGLQQKFAGRANVRLEKIALGATRETRALHLYSGTNMNSLLLMDEQTGNVLKDTFTKAGTTAVPVETLDNFCRENQFTRVDILKVDTQGYDLEVLKGAADLLKTQRIRTILVEVNFIPLYENQARFADLHEYLAAFGYRLVDFYNQNRPAGYTAWCDACYVAAES